MRKPLGTLLVTVGMLLMAYGLIQSLGEFGGLYEHLQDDALREPEIPEEERSGRMIGFIAIGAGGVIPFVAGLALRAGSRRSKGA